jgi:tetratricopeptide (TPR) repeat protein
MTDPTRYLTQLKKDLNRLQARAARYAGRAPLDLEHHIEDHEQALALTEQHLAGDLSEAEWREALKGLNVEPPPGSSQAQTPTSAKSTLTAPGSQIGVIGDHTHIEGGINFTTVYQMAPPQPVDEKTLAAAQATLARLPTDHVPNPAPLPPGSRLPFSPNPLFVGREKDFHALAGALKGGQTLAIGQIAAATGLGGIGKTQLAVEFAHRYGHYFSGGVFWLSFADPAVIPNEIALCGQSGHLDLRPDFGQLPWEDQVRLVASAWQSPLPRLLIFDNCEAEELVSQWRPSSGGCRVLLTSRRGDWSPGLGVNLLPLGVLSPDESLALLLKFRPDLAKEASAHDPPLPELGEGPGVRATLPELGDVLPEEGGPGPALSLDEGVRATLSHIAAEIGHLPLALHLAGSFLRRYKSVTPATYLAQLRDRSLTEHPSLTGRGATSSPTGHDLDVWRTFRLSYDRLDPATDLDRLALALLARAAHFAPGETIPRHLLLASLNLDDESDPLLAEDALARLVELGLLEGQANGEPLLHRLLVAFVRATATAETAQSAVEATVLAEASRLNQAGYPAAFSAWLVHLRWITDEALPRADEPAANLANELGYLLSSQGAYAAARPYLERALAIREKVLGADHPATATSLNNLGGLLDSQGAYEAARPYLERALAIKEKVLGADHPATATSLNNLGALLDSQGAYEAARPYYERALAIREKVLGPEHPNTRTVRGNLAALDRDNS